ncbi:MAG: helix-turn-helix domain-containing protein [Chthonomonas sp.]|nr:helix-turn-helix domain-containing protein [Chthonomonas sp.]
MTPEEAERLVLRHAERGGINFTWVASRLGVSKQSLSHWLTGKHRPQDPQAWVRIARAMGLDSPQHTQLGEIARELALSVLEESEPSRTKALAAQVIREISKKYE